MISPAIAAIAIAVLTALAFWGGFAVADWRSGKEIARLNGDNTLLSASNNKCAADIQSVRSAVEAMDSVAVERDRQARESMEKAQPEAKKHTAKVIRIRALAPVPKDKDKQCKVIKEEQAAYVQERRDGE